MSKLLKTWAVYIFLVCVIVLLVYVIHGVVTIVSSATFSFWFLSLFFIFYFRARYQTGKTPRLDKLPKPSFYSIIYDVWLYVNDRETWIDYVTILTSFVGSVIGSVLGIIYGVFNQYSFYAILSSWSVSILLMVSIALFINRYLHKKWKDIEPYKPKGVQSQRVAQPFFRRPGDLSHTRAS